jgi:hypothetical protein
MLAKLMAQLGLDAKPFEQGMKGVGKSVKKSGRKWAGDLRGQLAATFAAGVFLKASKDALQFAKDTKHMSQAIGLTTDQFQQMDYLFKQMGADTNDVTDAFGTLTDKMQDAMGGAAGVKEDFKLVGLEADKMKGKTPWEAFMLFADAAKNTEDKSRVLTSTIRTFGDDLGRRVLPLVSQGSEALREMANAANEFSISEESINALEVASKKMDALMAGQRSWFGEFLGNLTNFAHGVVTVIKLMVAPIEALIVGLGALLPGSNVSFKEAFVGQYKEALDEINKADKQFQDATSKGAGDPAAKFLGQGIDFELEKQIKTLEEQVKKRKEQLDFAKLTTAEQRKQLAMTKEQAEEEAKALRETGKPEDKKKALELEMKAMEAAQKLSKSSAAKASTRSLTSAQQIGALVRSPQGLVNLARQQLAVQKQIEENTKEKVAAATDTIYP